jgi:hypothetical protein
MVVAAIIATRHCEKPAHKKNPCGSALSLLLENFF